MRLICCKGQTEAVLVEIKQSLDADLYGNYHFQLYDGFGQEEAAATD